MHTVMRREFLGSLGIGAMVFMTSLALRADADPAKPNVVFILSDDLGWASLGCYGSRFNKTPNIDRLAAEGMRFTNAYAAGPVSSPTRGSILAGQYPPRLGLTDFIPGHWRPYEKLTVPINRQQYLALEAVTVAEALKPAGYATAAFGKWHLGEGDFFPDRQGFDEMLVATGGHFKFSTVPPVDLPDDVYLSEFLTDRAEAFIEANKDGPFFLYLDHLSVHIPLEARKELIDKYEKKPKPDEGTYLPVYAAMVEHLDESVGRVLDRLHALDLDANTLVVFFSGNGGLCRRFNGGGPPIASNAPLRGEKGTLYEGGIRVPLIVRWPGVVPPGVVNDVPVSSIDFYPTLLDVTGAPAPSGHVLDGFSIVPLLKQTGPLTRDTLFWHYPHYNHSTPAGAVREGDWKLIEFYDDGHLELYHVSQDIGETRDLAPEMRRRAQRLQEKLAAWRAAVGAEMPTPNPDYDPARAGEWGTNPGRK